VRVLIADDHPFFRDGMRMFLETTPDITVIGEAATGDEAMRRAITLAPAVVLMDIKMPGASGIEATRRIREECLAARVLIVTMFEDDATVFTAMRAGARPGALCGCGHPEGDPLRQGDRGGEAPARAGVRPRAAWSWCADGR
jgi:DNA-binding NarL/FixJ family response regulator